MASSEAVDGGDALRAALADRDPFERARRLEDQGRAGNLRDAEQLLVELSAEVDLLITAVRKWMGFS